MTGRSELKGKKEEKSEAENADRPTLNAQLLQKETKEAKVESVNENFRCLCYLLFTMAFDLRPALKGELRPPAQKSR